MISGLGPGTTLFTIESLVTLKQWSVAQTESKRKPAARRENKSYKSYSDLRPRRDTNSDGGGRD